MSDLPTRFFRFLNRTSLVVQIIVGLVAGCVVALLFPAAAQSLSLLGDLFVQALKSVAPVLVFALVTASWPIISAASRRMCVLSCCCTRWAP